MFSLDFLCLFFHYTVMPSFFNQTKFKSFQRQLNLYGFSRITRGANKGCYLHEHFVRGETKRSEQIVRKRSNDTSSAEAMEQYLPSTLTVEPTPMHQTGPSASSSQGLLFSADSLDRTVSSVLSGNTEGRNSTSFTSWALDEETSTRAPLFPDKLHDMLDYATQTNQVHVISWEMDGKAFKIHRQKEFSRDILPKFFNQTKYESLQRQMNLYNFKRIPKGPLKGCYHHPLFIRGARDLSKSMARKRPEDEPVNPLHAKVVSKAAAVEAKKNEHQQRQATMSPTPISNVQNNLGLDQDPAVASRNFKKMSQMMNNFQGPFSIINSTPQQPHSMMSNDNSWSFGSQVTMPPPQHQALPQTPTPSGRAQFEAMMGMTGGAGAMKPVPAVSAASAPPSIMDRSDSFHNFMMMNNTLGSSSDNKSGTSWSFGNQVTQAPQPMAASGQAQFQAMMGMTGGGGMSAGNFAVAPASKQQQPANNCRPEQFQAMLGMTNNFQGPFNILDATPVPAPDVFFSKNSNSQTLSAQENHLESSESTEFSEDFGLENFDVTSAFD